MKHFTNRTIALAATLVCGLAAAADDSVVIKDTRQYEPYTTSISGAPGCKMPKDPLHVKEGECEVTKGRYIASGELLIRYAASGMCIQRVHTTEAMHKVNVQGGIMEAPDQVMTQKTYKCNADGSAG